MSAASAFPQTGSPFRAVASPIFIPERGQHIPASYVRNPHSDPENTIVTQDGSPVLGMDGNPFSVAQVAEERRWAIQSNGEVLDQITFAEQLGKNRLEFYSILRERGSRNAQYVGDMSKEPVPNVKKYVSWRVDPRDATKLLQIGYDPHATDGARPEAFFDGEGERLSESRMDMLVEAYHNPKLRRSLTSRELDEVRAHLELTGDLDNDGLAAKLDMLTQLKTEGLLTDEKYMEKVAALTGKKAEKREAPIEPIAKPETEPLKPVTVTCEACGAAFTKASEFRAMAALRMHARHCKGAPEKEPE